VQPSAIYEELKTSLHWGKSGPNKTIERYASQFCTYFEGVNISEVTYPRLKEFVAHLRTVSTKGQALSGASVNRHLAFIGVLFEEASKHLPDFRPPAIPREPENTSYRQQTLSKDDCSAVLGHLNAVDTVVFQVLMRCGCRVGEILGDRKEGPKLRPEHISDGFVELVDCKNGDDRQIYPGPTLANQLRGIVERGELPIYETFRNRLRRAAKRAKVEIPYRMIHGLRHSFCTRAADMDVPVDVAMKAAGHRSYQSHSRYRRLSKETQKRGAKQMMELMNRG
jgi:integrase